MMLGGISISLLLWNIASPVRRVKVESFLSMRDCRLIKHIGQGKKREPLWEQPNEVDAWGGNCCDFGG